MLAAARHAMDIPAEYKNQHLRYQTLMYMIEHAASFFPLVKDQVAGIYGVPAEDPDAGGAHPGPFSYASYLNYLMCETTWGDEVFLMALACMFDLKVTVLNGIMLNEIRLRHQLPLSRAVDLVLIYNGSSHYSKASEYAFLSRTVT
jgi:hypothetical protein